MWKPKEDVPCAFEGCGNKAWTLGWCAAHRREYLKTGAMTPRPVRTRKSTICSFPECGRPEYVGGLCRPHHGQREKGWELLPIGSLEARRRVPRKNPWLGYTPERRAAQVAAMQAAARALKPHEWSVKIGEQRRAEWQRRKATEPGRHLACAACGELFTTFAPGRALYCSPECKKINRRAVAYGIDPAELRAIEERQRGRCAICRSDGALHVDHDHVTGRVRGFLCINCNTGLGKLSESVEVLQAAIKYLRAG